MKRYAVLLRDTWYFWLGLNLMALAAAWFVNPVFICSLPISLFAFFYFGLMRYDENGNRREGL